jgi:uncharacterized protein YpmS
MGKIKIFRLDVFFWIVIAALGACWHFLENKEMWKTFFLLAVGFYSVLSFIIRAFFLQSQKENQRITELSEIKIKQHDSSMWLRARGIIISFNALGKVVDNGKEAGRLFAFMVQLEGDDNSRWRTLIKDKIIPESHLKSFGKYTELMVLYNPENKYEAVFENENWHYETPK